MSFTYEINHETLKKMLINNNWKYSIFALVIGIFIFLFSLIDMFLIFPLITILFVILFVMILLLIIKILNNLIVELLIKINEKNNINYGVFKVKITKNAIAEDKLNIKFKNIKKIIYDKNYIYIKYKNDSSDDLIYIINKDFLTNKNDFYKITLFMKQVYK